MDKQRTAGIALISLLFIIYLQFFAPKPQQKNKPASSEIIQKTPRLVLPTTDTVTTDVLQNTIGKVKKGTEQEIVIENDVIKIIFSSKGGSVKKVFLKKYQTYQHLPLVLLDENSSKIGLKLPLKKGTIHTDGLFFTSQNKNQILKEAADTGRVVFTLPIAKGAYIEHIFTLTGQSYTLDYQVKMTGMEPYLTSNAVHFVWHNLVKRVEKNCQESRDKTTINYYLADNKFDHLSERTTKNESKQLQSPIKWVNVKQKFFSAGIIAANNFSSGQITTSFQQDTLHIKPCMMDLVLPMQAMHTTGENFTFYFGPNKYNILKNVTDGFSNNIYLGWSAIKWINQFLIIPIFNFIEKYSSNYGIIIIILVIIIKLLLFPLSYKSYIAMSKMKSLKPALDALKERCGGDMKKIQMEQIKLYREMGINPLSGCIPILLQIPILFALFNFFPSSIELRQQGFLWAHDLSTYDSICKLPFTIPFYGDHVSLFTILMTASTILYTWSNNQVGTAQGPMKTVSYMMPVMFMFVLNSFPAGLSFYYFIANLITFGQQMLIKKSVDENKIKQKLEENKKKQPSNSKFSFKNKLEQAIRASEKKKKNR